MSDTRNVSHAQVRSIGVVLLQGVAGVIAGGLLAVCGGWVGPFLSSEANNGWNDLIGSVLGALAGYALGAPLGVGAAAALLNQRGRPLLSMLGSILGGVLTLLLAEPLHLNQNSNLLVTMYALLVLVGALGGFHLRRRPRA